MSRMVDMVFYSSVPINNELIREAKGEFWNGIVVPRGDLENYIEEADVILIGPGMERNKKAVPSRQARNSRFAGRDDTADLKSLSAVSTAAKHEKFFDSRWENNTRWIVNHLLKKYPDKKWVVDAGALQMLNPSLLSNKVIITPHEKEFEKLISKLDQNKLPTQKN